MQDFIFFLGRFHVLVLHLPIGIILAAVALDWIARSPVQRDGREDDADRQMQHQDVESAQEIDEVLHSFWRVAAPSRPPLGMRL